MKKVDYLLPDDEYYKEVISKNIIYLHHTAGSHRPDFSINGWDKDQLPDGRPLHVATSYIIGGKSTRDPKDIAYDGLVYRAFDDKYWAHHLGTSYQNNTNLNKSSVAIEICNYGPLKLGKDGNFYTYVNSVVPKDQVCELPFIFKGYKFYHKYTEAQIEATKELILDIANRHGIDIHKGLIQAIKSAGVQKAFDILVDAQVGRGGMYTHVNILATKFDCHPQKEFVDMLLSL